MSKQTKETRAAAVQVLLDRKPVKIECGRTFHDDHILGVNIKLNGQRICLPWCGEKVYAACLYASVCPEAREDLRNYLGQQLQDEDNEDPFTPT